MVPARCAMSHLVTLVSALMPYWAGIVVAYAEPPKDYTAPPKPAPTPAPVDATPDSGEPSANSAKPPQRQFFIREYRVMGSKIVTPAEIGDTVYPYLGPGRTMEDVQHAREALEKVYHDKGYQTVTVQFPEQFQQLQGHGGVIFLEVTEVKVGRLRVKGSHYFSLDAIKRGLPSVAEGKVPNFNDLTREFVALNQLPDRRLTQPDIRPGVEPGTVDIDLHVEDTFPLHGSVEVNNRYSPDTSELRLNGGVSYSNLWQLGHAAGASFQVSPQNLDDVKVISGYYLARFPNVDWLTLTLQATKQDSNVSTLSGAAVAGKGESAGVRAGFSLPPLTKYVHSLTLGIDYKHYEQNVLLGLDNTSTPTSYYPFSIAYTGTWLGKGQLTELNAGLYFHFRGMGSSEESFDRSRYKASGDFIYFRGDLAHEHDLPGGFQAYAKVQGQIASGPLLSAEQFSAGGLSSVRGYLEGEVPGDNAIVGSVELRSPNMLGWVSSKAGEWRIYGFADAAWVTIDDPLPEQDSHWLLASFGAGTHLRVFDHLNGSLDAGLPLVSQSHTVAHDWLLTFRVWSDF